MKLSNSEIVSGGAREENVKIMKISSKTHIFWSRMLEHLHLIKNTKFSET